MNAGPTVGQLTGLNNDDDYIKAQDRESNQYFDYVMSLSPHYHCKGCLNLTPGSFGKYGDASAVSGHPYNEYAQLIDVESILSNRNIKHSKSRMGDVNPVDVTRMKLYDKPNCGKMLEPEYPRYSAGYSKCNSREVEINRFLTPDHDPSRELFWDFARNTRLEARDNYVLKPPKMLDQSMTFPKPLEGKGYPVKAPYPYDFPQCDRRVKRDDNALMNDTSFLSYNTPFTANSKKKSTSKSK